MGFSFFGLFGQNNKFKTVDAKEFAAFIKDTAKVTVLDVRTAAEHAEGYIPGTHFNIDVLEAQRIEVIRGCSGDVEELVAAYLAGNIKDNGDHALRL